MYKRQQKELVQINSKSSLKKHLNQWKSNPISTPLGYVLSLEGADSIISMDHLERMYNMGLRAIGPAHYGPGIYAYGTNSSGGIGEKGKLLLKKIEELKLILDVTHLCDLSFWETLEFYQGPIWASHSNCRKLVNNERQFDDSQIRILIDQNAVIGMEFDAWMMTPNWERGKTKPTDKGLLIQSIVDHIDHICQISGNTNHVMIGSDLDGGFGKEQCPEDLDTIADLQKLGYILNKRGFSENDIEKILSKNGILFLQKHLPS